MRHGRIIWLMAAAVSASSSVAWGDALEAYDVSFARGRPEGSLQVGLTACGYRTQRGGAALVMAERGVSEVGGTFELSRAPEKLYFRLDHATSSSPEAPPATFELTINDRARITVSFTSDAFVTTAQDITDYVHAGRNEFALRLANECATDYFVRGIDIVPVASVTEAVKRTGGSGGKALQVILAILGAMAIGFCGSALWRTVWGLFWGSRGTGAGPATLLTFVLCGLAALVWFVICLGFGLLSLVWGFVAAVAVCVFMALLERAVGEMR
ncbi:MAG: hypothetical protein ACE5O2_02975 [Armatimonadota bacterium]